MNERRETWTFPRGLRRPPRGLSSTESRKRTRKSLFDSSFAKLTNAIPDHEHQNTGEAKEPNQWCAGGRGTDKLLIILMFAVQLLARIFDRWGGAGAWNAEAAG
jgi:hypothetical protein